MPVANTVSRISWNMHFSMQKDHQAHCILIQEQSPWQEEKPSCTQFLPDAETVHWALCSTLDSHACPDRLLSRQLRLAGTSQRQGQAQGSELPGYAGKYLRLSSLGVEWERCAPISSICQFLWCKHPQPAIFRQPKWHWLVSTIPEKLTVDSCELV